MLLQKNGTSRLDPITFLARTVIAVDKYLVDDAMRSALHNLYEESFALRAIDEVAHLYAVMNAARVAYDENTMAKGSFRHLRNAIVYEFQYLDIPPSLRLSRS